MSNGPAVVMIAGAGRSGSTLLERLLATAPGTVAVGELTEVWRRGLIEDERCGCGERFSQCRFWSRVGERAFGGWDTLDPERMIALERGGRIGAVPLGGFALRSRRRAASDEYRDAIRRIVEAAGAESGASVVVDSSKWPRHLFVLRRTGLRISVAHLIRDPRAVAYSWAQATGKPHGVSPGSRMQTYSTLGSALRWLLFNLLVDAAATTATPTNRFTYRELLAEPTAVTTKILARAGLAAGTSRPTGDPPSVELAPGHGIAGNPMRFHTGSTVLAEDERWRSRMTRRDRLMVGAVCGPLWWRYRRSVRA